MKKEQGGFGKRSAVGFQISLMIFSVFAFAFMLAIELPKADIEKIIALEAQGDVAVSIDLAAQSVSAEAGGTKESFSFEISPFDKALVEAGGWVEYADARY